MNSDDGRPKPEGDGIDEFLYDQIEDFKAEQRASVDYGLGSFSLRGFMEAGPSEPEWVFPGWVPRGEVCIFAAERGLGKTTLLMQMLLSVSTGQPLLGIPVESGIAFGLFHEDASSRIRGTYDKLFKEQDTDFDWLDGTNQLQFETRNFDKKSEERRLLWHGGPTHNFRNLERKIEATGGVKLLVIDTMKSVLAGDVDKGENVRHFLSALQALADRQNIAIVMTTHLNSQKKTAGSSEIENQGRSVFHLVRNSKKGLQATLTSIKLNCGPEPLPIPLEKTQSGFWRVRSDIAKRPVRMDAVVDGEGRGKRLRDIFFDLIENHPKGLSTRKTAPLYAPRFAARAPQVQRLGGSSTELVAEFETIMAEGFRTGELGEKQKDTRHSTKVLYVVDKGA